MSKRQSCEADAKLFLPKKENSTISKTLDVCIEDFLEKLEDAGNVQLCSHFIELPEVFIGYLQVNVFINISGGDVDVRVDTTVSPGSKDVNIIQRGVTVKACKVEGVCGNLPFENDAIDPYFYEKKIKPVKDLKEAMIASGNHKLELKITLTMVEDEWVVTR